MEEKSHLRDPPPKPFKKSGVVEITFCSTKLSSSVKSISILKKWEKSKNDVLSLEGMGHLFFLSNLAKQCSD